MKKGKTGLENLHTRIISHRVEKIQRDAPFQVSEYSTLAKSSHVIFHMKSGVIVFPRLPRLLGLKAEPDVAWSVDRLKRSIENTFS